MINLNDMTEVPKLLAEAQVIAVVGLSPKRERPSNMVARYLIEAGYIVIPVNPGHEQILGKRCYSSLLEILGRVDIANIFRKSEDVGPIVQQAVEKGCTTVWMQQGIVNHDAAVTARKNGLKVIMDRCIKVDHLNLLHRN
jgi:predicted CoA-binding protein